MGAVLLSLAYLYTRRFAGVPDGPLSYFVSMLDMNGEGNIPSWYSSILWAYSSFLAVACFKADALRQNWQWGAIAAMFMLLSLDEAASLHENIGAVLDLFAHSKGALSYSWVYYGFAFLVVAGLLFVPFLLRLPRSIVAGIFLGAAVFLAGALGMEMYGAAVESGTAQFPAFLNWEKAIALEETLEMFGVILNIHALQRLLRIRKTVAVKFA